MTKDSAIERQTNNSGNVLDALPIISNMKLTGLEQIDDAQKQTLAELEFYSNEQRALNEKLSE